MGNGEYGGVKRRVGMAWHPQHEKHTGGGNSEVSSAAHWTNLAIHTSELSKEMIGAINI